CAGSRPKGTRSVARRLAESRTDLLESDPLGGMSEWLKERGCKPRRLCVRRFESCSPHWRCRAFVGYMPTKARQAAGPYARTCFSHVATASFTAIVSFSE